MGETITIKVKKRNTQGAEQVAQQVYELRRTRYVVWTILARTRTYYAPYGNTRYSSRSMFLYPSTWATRTGILCTAVASTSIGRPKRAVLCHLVIWYCVMVFLRVLVSIVYRQSVQHFYRIPDISFNHTIRREIPAINTGGLGGAFRKLRWYTCCTSYVSGILCSINY